MAAETQALRSLIAGGQPFIAADCYSALTARIVEVVGFPAAYLGGRATAMMHYAIPDCGVLTPTEMVEQAARVTEAISIPLIVDADQGGESVADVYRSVRRFERVGVAGLHLEDEINPKHSTYPGPLMSISDMQARISAAIDARTDSDFLVIARCDELWTVGGGLPAGGGGSLEETIRRGIAYADAGADVFLPTLITADQVPLVAAEVPIPLTAFGKLLEGLSFSLFAGWGTFSAGRIHQEWAQYLWDHGDLPPEVWAFPREAELLDQAGYDLVVSNWCRRTGRSVRAQ